MMMFRVLTVLMVFGLAFSAHTTYAQEAEPTREELLEQSRNNPPPNQAQHLIEGTSHRLFNGTEAQRASEIIIHVREAITDCDKDAFEAGISSLTGMANMFNSRSETSAPSAIRMLAQGLVNQDGEDEATIKRIISDLRTEKNAAPPCEEEEEPSPEPVVQQSNESIMDEMPRDSWRPSEPAPEPKPEDIKNLEKKPPAKEEAAIRKLRKKIEDIEKRKKKVDKSYIDKNAPKTLSKTFSKKGVGHSVQNAESWGSSIWVTWQNAGTLYDAHKNRLYESIKVVQQQGGADKAELKILEKGFSNWQKAEKKIGLKLQEITNLYGDLGLIMDERQSLTDQSREQKCGYGGERNICDPLKERSVAEKEKMDVHNNTIKTKKKELQEYAEQIHFEVIGQGEVVAEEEPEECPPVEEVCTEKQRDDVPDFSAMVKERKKASEDKLRGGGS